jgi:hypothetical protein
MNENQYTFFWRDGTAEVFSGETASNALRKAGYGRGALNALDFYDSGDTRKERMFDKVNRKWIEKTKEQTQ